MDEELHTSQTLLSVSFVFVPLSGPPRLAFHLPDHSLKPTQDSGTTAPDSAGEKAQAGDSIAATSVGGESKTSKVHSFNRSFFADFLSAKAPLCDAVMDITIDQFVGYPFLLPSAAQGEDPVKHDVKSFNIVFTLDRSELLRNRGPFHVPTACARASQVVGNVLRYEEMRCGYLSNQLIELKRSKLVQVNDRLGAMPDCNLGSVLAQTFQSIRKSTVMRVPINRWLEVSLPPPFEPIEASMRAPIRPYQTFLPVDSDTSNLEAVLPRGTSVAVRTLLREANPCKSFQDLEIELDVPLETLLRAAGHLVEWHLGIISETVSEHNMYVVAPNADIAVDSSLYQDFESFSSNVRDRRWSLPGLLLQFSTPQSLNQHRKALGGSPRLVMEFIACLIWLIRSGLVIQLKTFIYLNLFDVPEENQMPLLEDRYRSREDFPVFLRLRHLFDGAHHVEEIMWRENITRERLFAMLDAYKDVLTTCMHE